MARGDWEGQPKALRPVATTRNGEPRIENRLTGSASSATGTSAATVTRPLAPGADALRGLETSVESTPSFSIRNQHGPAHGAIEDPAVIESVSAALVREGAGPDDIFLTPDDWLEKLWRGDFPSEAMSFEAEKMEFLEGERNACHDNVEFLVDEDEGLEWWIGYARNDGMWRTHSWAYDPATDTLIETTADRDSYIGVFVSDERRKELFG